MNPLDDFPEEWLSDVSVVRSGGRDTKGNPRPDAVFPRMGIAIVPGGSAEAGERSNATENKAVLYDGDPSFTYQSTDRIRVPAGDRMAGDWSIVGRPNEWPGFTEVVLDSGK